MEKQIIPSCTITSIIKQSLYKSPHSFYLIWAIMACCIHSAAVLLKQRYYYYFSCMLSWAPRESQPRCSLSSSPLLLHVPIGSYCFGQVVTRERWRQEQEMTRTCSQWTGSGLLATTDGLPLEFCGRGRESPKGTIYPRCVRTSQEAGGDGQRRDILYW